MPLPVVAVFDIGKTNKKLFLLNESYQIVFEKSVQFEEIKDEDGDPCEDLERLQSFIHEGLKVTHEQKDYSIRAINFSSYGASFVYLDDRGKPVGHLYSYLKPISDKLKRQFYDTYGGEALFSFQTASPVLGSLNSGMQLYRIKYEKPELFQRIRHALHLPQFLSYLLTGKTFSEITSIGCHTNLWHFQNRDYHHWVSREGILEKLPPLVPSDMLVEPVNASYANAVGIGLHDSSSALIPYLISFTEPFVLISTGTWAISLNPFNQSPLTKHELECDCLCFLQYRGTPVKASRLFAGHYHDVEVERISRHFHGDKEKYFQIAFDPAMLPKMETSFDTKKLNTKALLTENPFSKRDLSGFASDIEAYHQLVFDLVTQQYASTQLVIKETTVKKIFVDGGFGNNSIYMHLLARFFPEMEVYASSIPQASAIGAGLAIHEAWNAEAFPAKIIELKHYPALEHR